MSARAQRVAARNAEVPNAPPNPVQQNADANANQNAAAAQNAVGNVNPVPVVVGPLSLVGELLQTCGANLGEIHALETVERINSLLQLRRLDDRALSELASRLEKRSEPDRVQLPMAVLQNMKVLTYWLKRQHRLQRPVYSGSFTDETLEATVDRIESEKADEDADADTGIKPEKLDPTDWDFWELQFSTYLSHVKGAQGAPLDYVIRPGVAEDYIFSSTREAELYEYPLRGELYRKDNRRVFRLLQDLLKPTEHTWIQTHLASQNGRQAWLDLSNHFDGGGNLDGRMRRALDIIRHTTYRDERGLKFSEYAEKFQKAYLTLDKTTARKSSQEQVRLFLENIRNEHPELVAAKREARQQFPSHLNEAIQHVSITVTLLYPPSTIGQRRSHGRAIGATETEREVQRARVAQQVTQLDGIHTLFGVDVTNVARNFTTEEFNRLGAEGRDYVFSQRRLNKPHWRGRDRGRGRGRGRSQATRFVASLESRIAKLESSNTSSADQVSVLTEPPPPPPKPIKGSTNEVTKGVRLKTPSVC